MDGVVWLKTRKQWGFAVPGDAGEGVGDEGFDGTDNSKQLGLLDIVGLTVGAIVGADIYVASAFGSGRLGPASLLGWALAGVMALAIALTFARCAMLVPKVGGPYAYVGTAFGQFPGFLVGWALWIAEWTSLAVFPIAFARYLGVLIPGLSPVGVALAKVAFIGFITLTNFFGTRLAGTVNDLLTAFKLAPLALLTLLGLAFLVIHPQTAQANLMPFMPKGLGGLGDALVLIFWAYAGFELATIPAGEVRRPTRTVPVAIVLGMAIVTVFYLLTNLVLLSAVSWGELAAARAPLTLGFVRILESLLPGLAGAGGIFMTVGAIVSIAGSDESGTIGTSRLAYAMAADGHLPKVFATLHPKYGTPYVALLFQNVSALVAALIGTLGGLIRLTVFSLAMAYLLTSLATLKLHRNRAESANAGPGTAGEEATVGPVASVGRQIFRHVPYAGTVASLFLLSQVGWQPALAGLGMLGVGVLVYTYLSPEREMEEIKAWITSRRYQRMRVHYLGQRFLAWPLTWRRRHSPGSLGSPASALPAMEAEAAEELDPRKGPSSGHPSA